MKLVGGDRVDATVVRDNDATDDLLHAIKHSARRVCRYNNVPGICRTFRDGSDIAGNAEGGCWLIAFYAAQGVSTRCSKLLLPPHVV